MTRHWGMASCAVLLMAATPAIAQTSEATRRYEIAAGPMDQALAAFARQSGQQFFIRRRSPQDAARRACLEIIPQRRRSHGF